AGGAELRAGFAAARLAGLVWGGRAAGFFVAVTAAAALAIGLLPAFAAVRDRRSAAPSIAPPPPRPARRLRDLLVVPEIAVAPLLLAAAGLATRSSLRLAAADPGFAADRLLTAELTLAGERYPPAVRRSLSRELEARLAQLRSVRAVG